jgi:Ca2+-transporting ATPase
VLFAIVLGFVQEYRAERAMEALRKMAAPNAKVIRDGHEQTMPARELVPGIWCCSAPAIASRRTCA